MTVRVSINGSLNGGSVTITVYEDTDSDGTAENTETQTFNDIGGQDYTTLQGGTGNDYWLDITLNSGGDKTATPTLDNATVNTDATKGGELTTDVTLNGGSAIVTVNEDTDGDGTAENTETIEVENGTNTYSLYNIDGTSGNDYWLDVTLSSDGDKTSTPTANNLTLETLGDTSSTDSGTITTALGASVAASESGDTVDGASVTAGAGSTVTGQETATLSVSPGVLSAAATLLTVGETATLEDGTLLDATVSLLGAAETTEALPGTSVTTASGNPLSTASATEAVESGFLSATATPLSAPETVSVDETPTITAGSGAILSADDTPITDISPSLVTATATPLSATADVETLIAGTVTLSGSGVQGATVFIIDTDNDTVQAVATTDTNGDYSATVPGETNYHVAVQYDDGSQKYNALSKPYIS